MIAHRWKMKEPEREEFKNALKKSGGKATAMVHFGFFGSLEPEFVPGYNDFLARAESFLKRDKKPVLFLAPHGETDFAMNTIKDMNLGVPVVVIPTAVARSLPAHRDKKQQKKYDWMVSVEGTKRFEEERWNELVKDLEDWGVRELSVAGEIGEFKRFGSIAGEASTVEEAAAAVREYAASDSSWLSERKEFVEQEIQRKIRHGRKDKSKVLKWFKKGIYPEGGCVSELLVGIANHSKTIKLQPLGDLMWGEFPGDKVWTAPKPTRRERVKKFFTRLFAKK